MRKKFIYLTMALVMCLGLAVPALAAEVSNGVCTYELSNDPIWYYGNRRVSRVG